MAQSPNRFKCGQRVLYDGREEESFVGSSTIHYTIFDGKVVEKTHPGKDWCTAYGRQVIPSSAGGVYRWKFTVPRKYGGVYLGISSKHDAFTIDGFGGAPSLKEHVAICFGSDGKLWSKGAVYNKDYYGGNKCEDGYQVTMALDMDKGMLSYAVNGRSLGIAYLNLRRRRESKQELAYKMAVVFRWKGARVRIDSFAVEPNEKESIIVDLQRRLKEAQVETAESDSTWMMSALAHD